jgi:ferredoxin
MLRVQIDHDLCQGHGRCYDLAPGVFGEDEDGYSVLQCAGGRVPADLEAAARLAVANCPEEALSIQELSSRELPTDEPSAHELSQEEVAR